LSLILPLKLRAQAATDSRIISNALGTPGKACIVEFKSYMKMVFPKLDLYERSFLLMYHGN